MINWYYTCDHCGQLLDETSDYPESIIGICFNDVACDLCAECVEKLTALVSKFAKGGEG